MPIDPDDSQAYHDEYEGPFPPLASAPGDRPDVRCNKNPAQVRTAIAVLLTADELLVISAVIGDGETQAELADRLGKSQTWVFRRLRRAISKLAVADIELTPPKPGRRKHGGKGSPVRYVDPVGLNQLTVCSTDRDAVDAAIDRGVKADPYTIKPAMFAGRVRGTWKTGRRPRKVVIDIDK